MATAPLHLTFRPGDTALFSGVYQVTHAGHRAPHRVLVLKGDEFPPCRNCHSQVRYELAAEIEYAAHDWDFAGPDLGLMP